MSSHPGARPVPSGASGELFLSGGADAGRRLEELVASTAATVERAARGSGPGPSTSPDELARLVAAIDPCPEEGVPFDDVMAEVGEKVLGHGVRPWDPWCVAHLHSPTLLTAAATELAIGATNQSLDSYDQAPAATLVEDHLVRWLATALGLPPGASGVLTAGGTASNLLGLLLARDAAVTSPDAGDGPQGAGTPSPDRAGDGAARGDHRAGDSPARDDHRAGDSACGDQRAGDSPARGDQRAGSSAARGDQRADDNAACGDQARRGTAAARRALDAGGPRPAGNGRPYEVAADGLPPEAERWRIVTSAAAHFSVQRAAATLGLGRRRVVGVATDQRGRMDVRALDATVARLRDDGLRVIAIVGTAGTTDLGAIDPLDELAERAAALSAWFHVDAAAGSGLVLSERLRPLLAGVERADSLTADMHKLWWQPIGASALLVRDAHCLDVLRCPSDYLDRPDDDGDGHLNLVSRSLDTSRRFDALKILVSLRSTGRRQMARLVEHLVDTAAAAGAMIATRADFELLAQPATVMVLFRWRPPADAAGELDDDRLDAANTAIQRRLFASGRAVVGRTRYQGRVALKFTLVNPTTSPEHLSRLADEIGTAGAAWLAEQTASGPPPASPPDARSSVLTTHAP